MRVKGRWFSHSGHQGGSLYAAMSEDAHFAMAYRYDSAWKRSIFVQRAERTACASVHATCPQIARGDATTDALADAEHIAHGTLDLCTTAPDGLAAGISTTSELAEVVPAALVTGADAGDCAMHSSDAQVGSSATAKPFALFRFDHCGTVSGSLAWQLANTHCCTGYTMRPAVMLGTHAFISRLQAISQEIIRQAARCAGAEQDGSADDEADNSAIAPLAEASDPAMHPRCIASAPRAFLGDAGREIFLGSVEQSALNYHILGASHIHSIAHVKLLAPNEQPPPTGLYARYEVAARDRKFEAIKFASLPMVRSLPGVASLACCAHAYCEPAVHVVIGCLHE